MRNNLDELGDQLRPFFGFETGVCPSDPVDVDVLDERPKQGIVPQSIKKLTVAIIPAARECESEFSIEISLGQTMQISRCLGDIVNGLWRSVVKL